MSPRPRFYPNDRVSLEGGCPPLRGIVTRVHRNGPATPGEDRVTYRVTEPAFHRGRFYTSSAHCLTATPKEVSP